MYYENKPYIPTAEITTKLLTFIKNMKLTYFGHTNGKNILGQIERTRRKGRLDKLRRSIHSNGHWLQNIRHNLTPF